MSFLRKSPKLTFEDAMSVHVFRAQRLTYVELSRIFENYSRQFRRILDGKDHPESYGTALDKFSRGDYWHPEILELIERFGYLHVLSSMSVAPPGNRARRRSLKATVKRFFWRIGRNVSMLRAVRRT